MWLKRKHWLEKCVICTTEIRRMEILLNYDTWELGNKYFVSRFLWMIIQLVKNSLKKIHAKNTSVEEKRIIFIMTTVYSCSCFVSISRGLMTKPIGFLRVPLLKFVEQIAIIPWKIWVICSFASNTLFYWELHETTN